MFTIHVANVIDTCKINVNVHVHVTNSCQTPLYRIAGILRKDLIFVLQGRNEN